jgi:UDP-N-acetylmuramate dehydrogenase
LADPVAVAAEILGERAVRGAPLGALTTYRVGGPAALLLDAASIDDLARAREAVAASDIAVLVVGKGSNMLVADAGFPGLAITLGDAFAEIEIDAGAAAVRAGGAAPLPVVARRSAGAGLTGFEWAVGVPGSIGGAVRMNAGGHGADMTGAVVSASVADLDPGSPFTVELSVAQLAFGYRHSAITTSQIVVAADLQLVPGDAATASARIDEIVQWRRENQPGGQNAGSVFTNPDGDSAGRLIDAAGLKGFRVGSAHVSEKHANFMQADPGGAADDVYALIREVRRRVEEAMGVVLVPEVRLVGFDQ